MDDNESSEREYGAPDDGTVLPSYVDVTIHGIRAFATRPDAVMLDMTINFDRVNYTLSATDPYGIAPALRAIVDKKLSTGALVYGEPYTEE